METSNPEELLQAFHQALHAEGGRQVTLTTSLLALTIVVQSVQLAMRHPDYGPEVRPYALAFVESAIAAMLPAHPAIAAVMALGNNPETDTLFFPGMGQDEEMN